MAECSVEGSSVTGSSEETSCVAFVGISVELPSVVRDWLQPVVKTVKRNRIKIMKRLKRSVLCRATSCVAVNDG